jgi:hypothetical protein
VFVLAIFLLVCVSVGSARAALPLSWSVPVMVDHQPSSDGYFSVSCPSVSLCVAVDGAGNVVTSTNPSGGAGAWTVSHVDGSNALGGVSCPSVSLCVADDGAGNVVTSTNPTGGASAWTVSHVDNSNGLGGVSCPSALLCVAVDGAGNVVTSTNPTGGAGAWTVSRVERDTLDGVSCASVSLCVAVDILGDVVTSTDPTGGASAWIVTPVEGAQPISTISGNPLLGVSCPLASLCVAVDRAGNALTSTDPTGGASAWSGTYVNDFLQGVSCPSASLCVVVGAGGVVASSTDPTGGASTWTVSNVDGNNIFTGVSCASASLCVAVDWDGNVVVGVAALAVGKPHVSRTAVSQPLSCGGAHGAKCAVTLGLTAVETVKGGKVIAVTAARPAGGQARKVIRKVLALGTVRVMLAGGHSKTVVASLNATGKRLLASRHVLQAKLSVTEFAVAVSSTTVTFKAARTSKKHKR